MTITSKLTPLQQYCKDKQIQMTAHKVKDNDAMKPLPGSTQDEDRWYKTATHWKLVLTMDGRVMVVGYSQGSAHKDAPKVADVLDCLCSDATCPDTFEDFCSEYGYDTDSRRAERTFQACLKSRDDLREFLGDDFDAVVYEMERM